MVEVFRCVWDVLEDNGTLWLNIGDSYYNYRPGKGQALVKQTVANNEQDLPQTCARRGNKLDGLKEKDLIGIPWMLAFALRADGWYLRQDIIWHKPNPMPESVQDRCTKAHEYIFLLSKSQKYHYDNDAIKEEAHTTDASDRNRDESRLNNTPGRTRMAGLTTNHYETKNKRSVWTVTTKPYEGAHFAVFPQDLIEPCILAGAPVGGVVLDPFMGSGTTAQVAQHLGRKYLGCELNPAYAELQNKRLQQPSFEFA
jgi:DNA modification methylase